MFKACDAELRATDGDKSGVWTCERVWEHDGRHQMTIDMDCKDCPGMVTCTVSWDPHEFHVLESV